MFFAALTVKYRDIRHMLPFRDPFWMFATPVVFPSSMVPELARGFILNPLTGIIEGFRSALFGPAVRLGRAGRFNGVCSGRAGCAAYSFRRLERTFADII